MRKVLSIRLDVLGRSYVREQWRKKIFGGWDRGIFRMCLEPCMKLAPANHWDSSVGRCGTWCAHFLKPVRTPREFSYFALGFIYILDFLKEPDFSPFDFFFHSQFFYLIVFRPELDYFLFIVYCSFSSKIIRCTVKLLI